MSCETVLQLIFEINRIGCDKNEVNSLRGYSFGFEN